MYDCSDKKTEMININNLRRFISTIHWNKINSIGLYGGEISQYISTCDEILNMIPKSIPKFCITNGSWTGADNYLGIRFLYFCKTHDIKIVISSTSEHKKFQDQDVIKKLIEYDNVILKEDDTLNKMNPMGRLKKDDWSCGFKCKNINKPKRFAICPNGDTIFQNCDGVYPIVSNYMKDFDSLEIKCERLKIRQVKDR